MKVKIGNYPKNSSYRKVNIIIDKYDTWGLDHTLALIIYPALIQLKDTKHGVPHEFCMVGGEDYLDQMCFDFYSDTHSESFDLGSKEWDNVLDKMIWSFQQLALEDYQEKYYYGKSEYDFVESEDMFKNPVTGKMEETFEIVDKNPNSHFFDSVGLRLHEERIQEGLELFGKYYRNLWD